MNASANATGFVAAVLNESGNPRWTVTLPEKVSEIRVAGGLTDRATLNLRTFRVSFKASDVKKAEIAQDSSKSFITTQEMESTGEEYFVFGRVEENEPDDE